MSYFESHKGLCPAFRILPETSNSFVWSQIHTWDLCQCSCLDNLWMRHGYLLADFAWLSAPTPLLKLNTPKTEPLGTTPVWQKPLPSTDSGRANKRRCIGQARVLAPKDLFKGIPCNNWSPFLWSLWRFLHFYIEECYWCCSSLALKLKRVARHV